MQNNLTQTHTVYIDGKEFTIGLLPLGEARKVYSRVGKLFMLYGENLEQDTGGLSPLLFAGMAEQVSDADLEFLTQVFSAVTTVKVDSKTLVFAGSTGAAARDAVFAGQLDVMLEWLDACIRANFGGVISKMQGALQKKLDAKRPAGTEQA